MTVLLKYAYKPGAVVDSESTVQQAVEAMSKDKVGAAAIVDEGILAGIFTERDLMFKVVLPGKDPRKTKVSEVCTRNLITITEGSTREDALRLMVDKHVRHLPIVDNGRQMKGMISVRHLLQWQVEALTHELESMEAYMTADGPGG